ncbi:CHD1 helical C-terminal domain containing protein 1 [Aegotheles albertisi]
MEEMGFKDEMDGASARDSSRDGTDGQTTKKDLDGTAKEAAFVTGNESAPPCKTPLICCADGLDEDTFKICKELLRPFKKSLQKLNLPQHLPREKKLKNMKESLTIIGGRIDLFLQRYCRASEVQHWHNMLWHFTSLFSEMDAKQLQKLYKYIKNNQMDKFQAYWKYQIIPNSQLSATTEHHFPLQPAGSHTLPKAVKISPISQSERQLCCPSENPDSVPGLKEERLKQLYISWGLSRGSQTTSEVDEKTEIN